MASNRRSHRTLRALFVLVLAFLPEAAHTQVAVVVNRANSVGSLTLEQLRRLYLGTSTTFPSGTRVTLVESPGLRAGFYGQLLGMTQDEFKRHWVSIVFGGEDPDATPPKEIAALAELRRFVGEHPGAIAFIALADADSSVRIVTIGGVKPGDAKYPLRARQGDKDRHLLRLLDAIGTPVVH